MRFFFLGLVLSGQQESNTIEQNLKGLRVKVDVRGFA